MTTDLLAPLKLDAYKYTLTKIAYINSAKHGYSEFPINFNLAIFGANNYGKTASLTGLKLLLFPYTNFKNQYAKFFFENSDGKYTDIESYSFYFPSEQSFIIMETSNKDGLFCTILFKSAKPLEYGRYYVKASYDEIRGIFWEMNEDGTNGKFAQDLTLQEVDKKLKKFEVIRTTDQKQIAKIMYSGHRGSAEEGRFCTVPLLENTPECIDSFKSLFQSTFNSLEAQRRSLGECIAHIIESQKSRKEEKVEVDFDYIIAEHRRLEKQRDEITNLKNNESLWNEVKDLNEQQMQSSIAVASLLNRQYSIFRKNKDTISDQIFAARANKDLAVANAKSTSEKLADTKKRLNNSEGHVSSTNKQISKLKQEVKYSYKIFDKYGSKNTDEVEQIIRAAIAKKSAELDDLRSMDAATAELKKINAELSKLLEDSKEWHEAISKIDTASLSSLDEHSASCLLSLNEDFSIITGILSREASQAAKDFASHFKDRDGVVYFDGKKMPSMNLSKFSSEEMQEKLLDLIDAASEKEQGLKKKKRDLERFISGSEEERIQKLKSIENAIFELKNERTFIAAHEKTISDLSQAEALLAKYNEAVSALKVDEEKQITEAQDAYEKQASTSSIYESVHQKERKLDTWYSSIKRIYPSFEETVRIVELSSDDADLKDQDIFEITALRDEYSKISTNFNSRLNALMNKVPLSISADEQWGITRTTTQTDEIIRKYYNLFLGLNSLMDVYSNEVSSHTVYVYSMIQELVDSENMINNFIAEINNEINKVKISNLSEVQLSVSINRQFESLVTTAKNFRNKSALDENALFPVQFYEEMSSFSNKFFDTNKKVLKMNMIIDGIDYKYKLNGDDIFQTKSQSGGTCAAIAASIISILLKKVTPKYVTLGIPIVIDEISTLDSENQKATIQHIQGNSFSVFCATPEYSASLVHAIGNHIEIDSFNVDKPMVYGCNTLVLPSFIENVSEA